MERKPTGRVGTRGRRLAALLVSTLAGWLAAHRPTCRCELVGLAQRQGTYEAPTVPFSFRKISEVTRLSRTNTILAPPNLCRVRTLTSQQVSVIHAIQQGVHYHRSTRFTVTVPLINISKHVQLVAPTGTHKAFRAASFRLFHVKSEVCGNPVARRKCRG
jgi:hypothetical protein